MNFPKDICEDCYKKGTCPNYGNPQAHIIHGKIDLIKSSGNINEFKKVLYRELHKKGIFKGPIEINKKIKDPDPKGCDMDCEFCSWLDACSRPYDVVKKSNDGYKKHNSKKVELVWEN